MFRTPKAALSPQKPHQPAQPRSHQRRATEYGVARPHEAALSALHPSYHLHDPQFPQHLLHPSTSRQLVDSAPHYALFLADHDGHIQSWNRGAEELTGQSTLEVVGQPLHRVVKADADNRFQYDEALWRASQQESGRWQGERYVIRADGTFLPVVMTVTVIRDQGQNLMGYAVALRPHLENTEAEQDLRDSLALLKTIIETLPDPIFVKDREGRYLLVNSAFARHFARSQSTPAAVLGKTDYDLLENHEAALLQGSDLDAMEHESAQEVEVEVADEPAPRFYLLTKLPFINAAGQVCGVIGVAREVTAQRQQEEQRELLLSQEKTARHEAEKTVRLLAIVQAVSDTALAHLEPNVLIAQLLDRVCSALGADTASLCLLAPNGKVLDRCQSLGQEHEELLLDPIPLGHGLIGHIAATREPMIVADRREIEVGTLFDNRGIVAFIGVPLQLEKTLLGVLYLGSETAAHFGPDDQHILGLVSERIAAALERGRLFEELQGANDALHRMSQRLIEVQEEERRHLSRELHDEVGQILTGIKLHLKSISSGGDRVLSGKLSEACGHVDEAIAQVRRLSAGLRPASLDALGLVPALREYLERMATNAGIEAHFAAPELENSGTELPKELQITLFRIAQEAIANVVRHSRAANLDVELRRLPDEVQLIVVDDGLGFDPNFARQRAAMGTTLGLKSMEERAVLLGGTLKLRSKPGKGCQVEVTFPLSTPETAQDALPELFERDGEDEEEAW
jgi:PAS domain S-box-containing protein